MNLQRILSVPVFLFIEKGLLARTGEILAEHNFLFHRPLVLSGRHATYEIGGRVSEVLSGNVTRAVIEEASEDSVREIGRSVSRHQHDVIIGVGGGRVLDVGKLASYELRLPFVAVPTALSSDGIASPISVISRGGRRESIGSQMPLGVLIDVDVLSSAPTQTLRAGIGDLLSNASAIEDWKLASRLRGERIDSFALFLSRMAYETFVEAVDPDEEPDPLTRPDVLIRLSEGLLLSGLAMAIAGTSRPCSGAEHLVSHALDHLLPNPHPHGLQVAVSTLLVQRARGHPLEAIARLFRVLGLPQSFRDLGIAEETFHAAIDLAPKMRPGRATLFDEIDLRRFHEAAEAEDS